MSNPLWIPDSEKSTQIQDFINHVNRTYGLSISTYNELHQWSVDFLPEFWKSCVDFSCISFFTPPTEIVKNSREMPNQSWFSGATLNYAFHCLQFQTRKIAIYDVNERGVLRSISCSDLYDHVSRWVQYLLSKGIKKGDVVAGIVTNQSDAIIGMLATASIGAVWTSCSPDFGEKGIIDRLSQVRPSLVIAVDSYEYKGKAICILDRLVSVKNSLPDTLHWVLHGDQSIDGWELAANVNQFVPKKIEFVSCDFNDPLFILFSSGTTGYPKCIVHSVGGTLVQHVKEHRLHCDISFSDTLFYYTTAGWMMWNWMASALASHASIVCYDGSPLNQNSTIWDIIPLLDVTIFGCSASFIGASEKKGLSIGSILDHESLRLVLSTGSPLLNHHYEYFYDQCRSRPVQLGSISGGTDIISCFALCNPIEPVYKGKIQCIGLGMDVVAFDENGYRITNKKGDLVCIQSSPSMPIYFLNDHDNQRYKAVYFKSGKTNEWYHGDYVIVDTNGQLEILGRSDSTLNPGGVRMGSAEFYQVVDGFEDIQDSLVTSVSRNGDEKIILFVQLNSGVSLTSQLKKDLRYSLRDQVSPRHMPHMILEVTQIPYTANGKKCEVGIKKLINKDIVYSESIGFSLELADEYVSLLSNFD